MDSTTNTLLQRYELGRLLGQGTFGKVYYARSAITNQSVAIKVIDKDKVVRTGQCERIKREVTIMRLVRHPYIIQLLEIMATKSKIYFVMEYAKGGELFDLVAKGKLKEEVAYKYFRQLVNAVDFCHSRGVYHRDIKPENLLLDENENLKVSDFGLSALAESKRKDGLLHTTCGTPSYVAPEVIRRKGYDGIKADIWSCGVVLFVLLAGYLPFHDSNLIEMYRKISKGEFICPSWFPNNVRRLLCKMLDPDPENRATIAKIRESSWFRKGPNARQKKLEDSFQKREARFTSRQPAPVIISRLEEIAKRLKMKIKKKAAGLLKLEGLKEGRKGNLSLDAEIFEVTPYFHLVEVKKSNGDTMEYQEIMDKDIRPALKDIVWVWQGENQQEQSQQSAQLKHENEEQ
ncbi:hypothetical protein Ahy_B07g087279 isoform A [Arachis hypogaea]|uniref:non-specific serine/threonine protein kinase n=1 Tax=Arachis hypogaea TaxID=3818 RepID=A0A444YBM6_ARAHY|nr:hypothetical protein Ahy_B07g087279 isoform A [Arachis hypogaea]